MNSILAAVSMVLAFGGALFLAAFGIRNVLNPKRMLAWQAKQMRTKWRDNARMSDKVMDEHLMFPGMRSLIGSRSRFINVAPEHPEEFPTALVLIQLHGLVLATMASAILFGFVGFGMIYLFFGR